jgi:hypothetical protein
MHVGRDVVDVIAPMLHEGPSALDTWSDRLVMYAAAMVQAEGQRRQAVARPVRKVAQR